MVASPICQKPLLEEREWDSIDPVKSELLAPPRYNSEFVLASLKPKDCGETLPCENAVSKNVFCLRLDMVGKAKPRILRTIIRKDNANDVNSYPSIGSLARLDDNVVTDEKYWPEAWMPATLTAGSHHGKINNKLHDIPVSVYTGPDTLDLSP